ncbi:biofilm PGA synthesis N-glycosyltransferase PgaC [Streptomyces sp. LBL]|uniref:glycosyltransferase family 2 protein n=1 Tax=Streptomyces sp. LBL TaxID=2940562 RepID=UPI0024744D95|nr:glycosyltransferase family 2 protein [Streptomyces sp. LBL]MDH6625218.1 biofilm PGA synthesis N-glycosyltransferase PgaC [Streptomyces sp. LBL]
MLDLAAPVATAPPSNTYQRPSGRHAPLRAHAAPDEPGHVPRLAALIPAHNEQDRIAAAIQGLRGQTRPPDLIVVVADNCTDDTATIAAALGAQVYVTQGNTHRKAGALNQAITWVLPHLDDRDLLLVQDADTVLNPSFAETAVATFNRRVGAVGGVFYGEQGGGFLGLVQRMEFHRYAWELKRTGGKAQVLTGTGTMFRGRVLREVRAARRIGVIGGGTSYYSLASLTEDDEMTKAVKTLGYRAMSPAGCAVTTEVMPTLGKLWHQRLRWQRGALENLRDYGWTRVTARYFAQQFLMGFGALSFLAYLTFLIGDTTLNGWPGLSPFWTAIGVLFMVEKTVSVRRAGPRAVLVAALMIPEMLYDLFQHAVYFSSLWGLLRRSEEKWVAT